MELLLSRRRFLALPLGAIAWARLAGAEIDRDAGRYRVTMTGRGAGVSARTEGAGIIQDGRFKPTRILAVHTVRGHDNRTELTYDYERGLVEYHSVSYT